MKLHLKILVLLIFIFANKFNCFDIKSLTKKSAEITRLKINCDSIYSKKGFSVLHLMNEDKFKNDKNSIFVFQKTVNGKTMEIYRDTIFSAVQKVEFIDYNNDKVKDILVQNISDVRSNWTYYLYLVNPKTFALTKIKGFEEIKGPIYNPKYNIIENYVISGQNWTSFYKIKNDKVYDYDIVIYDGENEKGINTYEKDYAKAIQTIRKRK